MIRTTRTAQAPRTTSLWSLFAPTHTQRRHSLMQVVALVIVWSALACGCTRNVSNAGQGAAGGQISFNTDTIAGDGASSSLGDAFDGGRVSDDLGSAPSDGQACALGASRCGPTGRELCSKEGWAPAKCDLIAPVCVDGDCRACVPNAKYCADVPLGASYSKAVMLCDSAGASSAVVEACATGPCVAGQCLACESGTHRCNAGVREVCAGGGQLWSPDYCPTTAPTCVNGDCKVCEPTAKFCGEDASGNDVVNLCDGAGSSATTVQVCAKPLFCSGGSCVVCEPGTTTCQPGALATCKSDGSAYDVVSCPAATPACVKDACRLCEPGGVFCRAASDTLAAAVMVCGPKGDTASAIKACGADQVCHKNTCKNCVPGLAVCIGMTPLVCDIDGTAATVGTNCAKSGLLCGAAGCACGGKSQGGGANGASYCGPPPAGLKTSAAVWSCGLGGLTSVKTKDCSAQQVCAGGKCMACVAGAQRCVGNKVMTCSLSGQSWSLTEDCSSNKQGANTCVAGACVDVCALQDGNTTNVGCRFWAADLDNAKITAGASTFDAQNAPYGVALVNSGLKASVVTITYGPSASIPIAKTLQLTLPVGAAKSVVLPPADWKVPPASLDGTSQQGVAFRIDTTAPIAAFQHNPLQANAFSADASVLLPANALGTSYRVMSRKQSIANLRAYVAIVATRSGTTKVNITPTSATVPGGAIPALTAGVSHTVSIQQGQVLNLETANIGDDLTGTLVTASKPVAVFAGAEAAHAPDTDVCLPSPSGSGKVCAGTNKTCVISGDCVQTCCADHVESQLPPISAWGTTHIAGRFKARGSEPTVLRILAAHNGTKVLVSPSLTPIRYLQAGQWFEVMATKDLIVEATKPVLVGQFMASSGLTGKSLGDPAFAVLTPVDSMGRSARFWVPSTYPSNYATITTPSSAILTIDGKIAPAGAVIPSAGWSVWRVALSAGVHSVESTGPVAAVLHGWSKDGSYAHAVGHGLH